MEEKEIVQEVEVKQPERRTLSFSELVMIMFGLYVIIVLWGVLFKCNMNYILEEGYLGMKNTSFTDRIFIKDDLFSWLKGAMAGDIFNSGIVTAFLNCILLVPFGICCMQLLKKKSILLTTLFAFLFCLTVELIQLHTFWGFFSFDDLFTNTLGGLIGAGLYKIIYRPERERVLKYITIACIAILVPLTVYAVIRTGMDMEFYLSLATRTYR